MVKIIFAHLCQGPALEASWLWMAWQPPLVFSTEERREGFSLLLALLLVPPTPSPRARYPADNVPTLVPISCMPGQFAWFRTAAPTVVSNNLLTGPPTPWRSLTKLLYPTNSCRRAKSPFLGGIERGGSGRVVHAAVPRDPAKVPPPFLRRKDPFRVQVSALMRIPPLTAPLQYRYNGSCQ